MAPTGSTRGADENSRDGPFLQLQAFVSHCLVDGVGSGFEALLTKVLVAQMGKGFSKPVAAGPLDLLLPFVKVLRFFGEAEECHILIVGLPTAIRTTAVWHVLRLV